MALMVSIGAPSLAQERRDAVRSRILAATRALLTEDRQMPRMEDVARRAGVGRRTVFRYFSTQRQLAVAALRDDFERYWSELPEPQGPLRPWLEALCRAVHARNAEMASPYLMLLLGRHESSGIGSMAGEPGTSRRGRSRQLADSGWRLAGRRGRAPDWLARAFTLHLSVFTTEALRVHERLDSDDAAAVTAELLARLVESAQPTGKR